MPRGGASIDRASQREETDVVTPNKSIGSGVAPRSRQITAMGVALRVATLVLGILAGREMVSIAVTALRHRSVAGTVRSLGVLTAILALGTITGAATGGITGAAYRPPTILFATGSTTANVAGGSMTASGTDDHANCASEPDGIVLGTVAFNVGPFGPGTLSAHLEFETGGAVRGELLEEGAAMPNDGYEPSWFGPMQVVELNAERTRGRVSFAALPYYDDPSGPGPAPAGWPASVSGTISWTCGSLH
jgi:hypothetical protein